MLRKSLAGLLLILTALPFTAPFATVDMPTLFGSGSKALQQETTLAPSVDDTSHALVAPSARSRTRIRTVLRLETLGFSTLSPAPAGAVARAEHTPTLALDRPSLTSLRI